MKMRNPNRESPLNNSIDNFFFLKKGKNRAHIEELLLSFSHELEKIDVLSLVG